MQLLNRAFWRLLWWLCPILLFVVGFVQVVRKVGPGWLQDQIDNFLRENVPYFSAVAFWTLLLFLPLAIVALGIVGFWRRPGILILETSAEQPLKIRCDAVATYLRERLEELPQVRKVRIQARSRKGALQLAVRVKVTLTRHLDEVQKQVRERLIYDVRDGFGLTQVEEPDIEFEAVAQGRRGPLPDELAPKPVPEALPEDAGESALEENEYERMIPIGPWRPRTEQNSGEEKKTDEATDYDKEVETGEEKKEVPPLRFDDDEAPAKDKS